MNILGKESETVMVTYKDGKIVDSTVCNGGNCERKSRGKPYRMLEWVTPRVAFEHWLDTGMTMNNDNPTDDEPCLFAGTGFSESDGEAVGEE